jgi:hypothetical protein
MMANLLKRGDRLAEQLQQQKVEELAQHLRLLFGSAAVEAEEARVLVRSRGIVKRWLIDPSLRFLGRGPK